MRQYPLYPLGLFLFHFKAYGLFVQEARVSVPRRFGFTGFSGPRRFGFSGLSVLRRFDFSDFSGLSVLRLIRI